MFYLYLVSIPKFIKCLEIAWISSLYTKDFVSSFIRFAVIKNHFKARC